MSWNAGAEHLFGYAKTEIIGQDFDAIFTAEDRAAGAPAGEMASAKRDGRANNDRWHVRKDRSVFWATNIVQPMLDDDGKLAGFTKIVRDATDRYEATEALRSSQEELRILVETVREYALFAVPSNGCVAGWNAGAQALFGYDAGEIVGKPFSILYSPEDIRDDAASHEIARAIASGFSADESWLVRKDGTHFFASGRLTRVSSEHETPWERGFVKVAYNITDRKTSEEAMRHLAMHDSLTGLPNRPLFIERLRAEIVRSKRKRASAYAVLFLDVDDFKLINDSLGHSIADRLLVALASRLAATVREADTIARIGGDEFAILLVDVAGAAEVRSLVDRVERALDDPFRIDDIEVFVTMSVGAAIDTTKYTEPEEALRDADIAMYVAKSSGRGQYAIFASAMREPIVARQRLDTQLRRAIARNEFEVAYQSIVDLRDDRTIGFEALVRWQHFEHGLLEPSQFLEAARKTQILVSIDRFVLATACHDAMVWRHEMTGAPFFMSVNVSARQFELDDFVPFVARVLEQAGFEPTCLKLEITESTLMENSQAVLDSVEQLRGLGIQLYIDDFGTGFSSLSYLAELPVDALKIDRSFVEGLGVQSKQEKIVSSIIDLAHRLELKVIAEGVSSQAHRERLVASGCDYAQGYLFSRPTNWQSASAALVAP